MQDVLRERGADVERAEVYRRVALPHDPAQVGALLPASDVVLVANAEALEQLIALTPEPERVHLLGLQLVVPSPRVVELAAAQGFTQPALVPDQMTDAGYVHCLEQWFGALTHEMRQ